MASMPVLRLLNPWKGGDGGGDGGSDDEARRGREAGPSGHRGEMSGRMKRNVRKKELRKSADRERDERRRAQNDPEMRRERISESRKRARDRRRRSPSPIDTRERRERNEEPEQRSGRIGRARERARAREAARRPQNDSDSDGIAPGPAPRRRPTQAEYETAERRRRHEGRDGRRERLEEARARAIARQPTGIHSDDDEDRIEPGPAPSRRPAERVEQIRQRQRRDRREAARERARERRQVPEQDEGALQENGENVTVGPAVDVEVTDVAITTNELQHQPSQAIDTVRMQDVARPQAGLFPAFYVWDTEAEAAREMAASARPQHFQNNFDLRGMCTNCGDRNHNRGECGREGWTVKVFHCRKCGCTLLGSEREGVCCGNRNPITFRRRQRDGALRELYNMRTFRRYSIHLNSLFAYVRPLMDMKYVRGGGPSFLKLYGNVALALPVKDSRYSFLWTNDSPSLNPSIQNSRSLENAVRDANVRRMVPILYRGLRPRPEVMRERYRNMFNTTRFDTDRNTGVDRTDVAADAARQNLVLGDYRGTHDVSMTVQNNGGPLPEDRAGLPTFLRSYTVDPGGLFNTAAEMVQITGGNETHTDEQGNVRVRCKKIKPSSKFAEWGAFPLLYPDGEVHVPFDIGTYVSSRNENHSEAGPSSSNAIGMSNYAKMTWGEVSKRRLYSDNILLESGTLLQQWALRTWTNVQDMRLEYLENEQTNRIVEERELLEMFAGNDQPYKPGRLFLPDNVVNSPAYWKSKLLDVQAIVSRRFLPSLFITITANTGWDTFKRLGIDVENRSSFAPVGSKPRIWDRPDIVARVYNQFANDIIGDLKENSETYFGKKCVGIAAKLEFQARNTPHHHILLFLEGGVIDDIDTVDEIISAELPTAQEDPELRELVKRFNMHRHSPYCKGRSSNGRCRFGYDDSVVRPYTTIDETCNRMIYRRRKQEDMRVVPYNADLTKKYKCHINVERTQGGGAIAYLMKYAFKPPSSADVELATRAEEARQQQQGPERERDPARDGIRNDVRLFMRARVTGAVEAVWNLLEFRHVKIEPKVEAFTIHLEHQRHIIIRNTQATGLPNSSHLLRYFKRPEAFRSVKFLDYFESVRFYKPGHVPVRVQASNATIYTDDASPRAVVVRKEAMDQEDSVARIRFVSPSNSELFALRIILLERPMTSYQNGMYWEGAQYRTWRDTAIAMGLYEDGYEHEKAFDEAVRIRSTPSAVRFLLIILMQHGGRARRMFEKHERYMSSDIQTSSPTSKRRELIRRLFEISDRHGGILLRSIPFFADMDGGTSSARTETQIASEHLHHMQSTDRRARVQEKLQSLNSDQRRVVDEVIQAIERRPSGEQQTQSNGKLFFLQGRAGTGKTYTLNILREVAQSRAHIVEITATTGIAAALYKDGRTVHSLLGLGVDDKDSTDGSSARSSKYGPRTERAKLLRRAELLIIDEASMIERRFFELISAVLKDLRCGRIGEDEQDARPRFGGINVLFAGDYMQLLPVVPSRRWKDDEENGGGHYVNVSLLDELPWASSIWEHVKVLRLSRQVRQADDEDFRKLLKSLCTGTFERNRPLPLRSTASLTAAYRGLWKWYSTGNRRHVSLSTMMVCPTNAQVDEHNEDALESFPGEETVLFSTTSVEPHRSGAERNANPHHSYVVPEMTYRFCPTGVPPHRLKLKIGAPVMVIRNVLHPNIVNGKMFVVKSHTRRVLCVAQLNRDGQEGDIYSLSRIKFQFRFHGVNITRKQFPVRLAFAGTVHKSQGQTLDKIVVDMRSQFFAPGQLYVALSRVRKSEDVLLLHEERDTPPGSSRFHPMPVAVKNPVLPEAVRFAEGDQVTINRN